MSRIYFHSPSDAVELRGSERAHMGVLCGDLLLASIGALWDTEENPSWLRGYLPADCYLHKVNDFPRAAETWLRVGHYDLIVEGKPVSVFEIGLNTASAMGNDAIKLCARLHGQCEVHAYIDGHNRAWLADIIEGGRKQHILRVDQGWEGVVDFLRAANDEPVVTSYSVCEQFPNMGVAVEQGLWEPDWEEYEGNRYMNSDGWYALPYAERWRLAFEAIAIPGRGLEIKPDGWGDYYFGYGLTGFALVEYVTSKAPAP